MGMPKLEKFFTNSIPRALMQYFVPTPFFLKHSKLPPKPVCLEIGCGQGAGAEIILKEFGAGRVIAIDYDPEQIELAKKNLCPSCRPHISFQVGDAARLSFNSNQFDAVFEYGILHHVANWKGALREIYRVLKPGGYFFYEDILTSLLENPFFETFFPHDPQARFTRKKFEQVLLQTGFNLCAATELARSYLLGVANKP